MELKSHGGARVSKIIRFIPYGRGISALVVIGENGIVERGSAWGPGADDVARRKAREILARMTDIRTKVEIAGQTLSREMFLKMYPR